MLFLDFLLLVFGFYLITQIFLPLLFPKHLQRNWLLKKTPTDKVEKLVNERDRIKTDAAEISGLNEAEIEQAKRNKELLKDRSIR